MLRSSPALAALLGLMLLPPVAVACDYPQQISIPDGNTASEDEMQSASQAVRQYMADVEDYLACLDEEEKSLGDTVTEEQKRLHVQRHNAAVDVLNEVAGRYNEQVQLFKKKTSR